MIGPSSHIVSPRADRALGSSRSARGETVQWLSYCIASRPDSRNRPPYNAGDARPAASLVAVAADAAGGRHRRRRRLAVRPVDVAAGVVGPPLAPSSRL